jgi:transcriptional regulator with XRE-family HTH domain
MPAAAPAPSAVVAKRLAEIGALIRRRRQALKVSATATAEAAGISRVTLYRIEKGEPSVAMAAYMSVVEAVGLQVELVAPEDRAKAPKLPKVIRLSDYPQLKKLAWQLRGTQTLKPKEALELYERNWRHVDEGELSDDERALIRDLIAALGGKRLLV